MNTFVDEVKADILDNLKKDPLSGSDLNDMIEEQIPITRYSDLSKIGHIDEVLDDFGRGIVLYNWNESTGHWIGLLKKGNTIEFYDPYGNSTTALPNFLQIPANIQHETGMDKDILGHLIEASGYNMIYNKMKHQQKERDVNTCGRHVGMRLLLSTLTNEEYNDRMRHYKKQVNLDDLVSLVSESLIGDTPIDKLTVGSGSYEAPAMTKQQLDDIHSLYYDDMNFFGRDKLWKLANNSGINISRRQVADWLTKQEVWQTNVYPVRNAKTIRSTVSKAPHKQIGIDLIDMQNYRYDGYTYILTGIDMFSKKGYAIALLNKEHNTVNAGLKDMLLDIEYVGSIRSDNGSEFISTSFKKILKDNNIKQVLSLPGKPQSNGQVERFNQTLKRMLMLAMKSSSSQDWVSILDTIVNNYNKSYQSTIEMTPNQAEAATLKQQQEIKNNITNRSTVNKDGVKFQVGDRVRVKLDKKGKDGARWSKEVYEIDRVVNPKSELSNPNYKLKGITGNKSLFYNNDLQPIQDIQNQQDDPGDDFYDVSKIIRPSVQKGVKGFIVRWKGFSAANDTWESRDILDRDIPKMIRAFEKAHNIEWTDKGFKWKK